VVAPAPADERRTREYGLLIVDDDPNFRATLRDVFEPYFAVVEAECGEEALDLASRRAFDVGLFDMQMRILSGIDTIRRIKAELEAMPCILITASYTPELVQEARAALAYDVLRKPVAKRQLIVTVSVALREAYRDPTLPERLGLAAG
jgi:two-component system, response regulator PdtaR